ncbi:MAG: gliding motility-associated ABC transporter substrate-binding protein GldG [Bacteroidota bacterium]
MLEKRKSLFQFLLLLIVVITINMISSQVFYRIDLTSDNRYTLKDKTVEILEELDDVVYFKIYLEGDLPVGLQRMQRRIKETLDEFRVHAGENIQYTFINPSEAEDSEKRQKFYKELRDKGLRATNVKRRDKEGEYSQKIIFPGAIVNHGEEHTAVNLLKDKSEASHEVNLNHSIQSLEYELIDAAYKLTLDEKPPIAFVEGHGELDEFEVGDITRSLSDYYSVDRIKLKEQPKDLNKYNALIIAKPKRVFSKFDKFALDQYVMHGGNIFWLIDRVDISLDSLTRSSETYAKLNNLNLNDQLFKYGVRINPNLIKDLQCAVIPINTSYQNNNPEFSPTPWVYFPLLPSRNDHSISRNLNLIRSEFISSIDTLPAYPGVHKTILLGTSEQTKVVEAPALVSLREVDKKQEPRTFRAGRQVTGVLLEGQFQSVFRNRFTDELQSKFGKKYKEKSPGSKMIVVSDGDIIKNDVSHKANGKYISPLGYDKYTRQTYGNKGFVMNSMHYLADKEGLINIRGKDIELRLLDKSKVQQERIKWQVINGLLPVLIIVIFGLARNFMRKRKFTT